MVPDSEAKRNGADWLQRAADLMTRGVRDRHSAWRTFSLATVEDGAPAVRSVALRGFERERFARERFAVEFWTDRRSAKVRALPDGAAAVFWDPRSHLQLRLRGRVELADMDAEAVAAVARSLPDEALRNYATLGAPGTKAGSGNPDERGGRELAYRNLLSCTIVPTAGDLVHLGRERHRRFLYRFDPFEWEEVIP